jgi:hypothetical protein
MGEIKMEKITHKDIMALFNSMDALGIKEIFLSKEDTSKQLIDDWFYVRNKNVKRISYVWGESGSSYWSFVKENIKGELLKITYLEFIYKN